MHSTMYGNHTEQINSLGFIRILNSDFNEGGDIAIDNNSWDDFTIMRWLCTVWVVVTRHGIQGWLMVERGMDSD